MENKETIVRESYYEYDEIGNLTSMTISETITNPHNGFPCEEGELLSSEVDFTEDKPTFTDAALALTGLGLCLTALVAIFKRR